MVSHLRKMGSLNGESVLRASTPPEPSPLFPLFTGLNAPQQTRRRPEEHQPQEADGVNGSNRLINARVETRAARTPNVAALPIHVDEILPVRI